jgi:hypothetical protein
VSLAGPRPAGQTLCASVFHLRSTLGSAGQWRRAGSLGMGKPARWPTNRGTGGRVKCRNPRPYGPIWAYPPRVGPGEGSEL